MSERDILYKVLFDLKDDVNELKKLVFGIISNGNTKQPLVSDSEENTSMINSIKRLYAKKDDLDTEKSLSPEVYKPQIINSEDDFSDHEEVEEESLSLADKEKEMIVKALRKHNNKRRKASEELGISERTLYRKIKEYDINE